MLLDFKSKDLKELICRRKRLVTKIMAIHTAEFGMSIKNNILGKSLMTWEIACNITEKQDQSDQTTSCQPYVIMCL
jgi:hypothetical protein